MTPDIPVIDIGPLAGGGGPWDVARQIGEACRTSGFFYVRNTGVPSALRAEVSAAAQRFFGANPALKAGVSISGSRHNRGYVGMQVEALDPRKGPDLKEAFNIGLELDPDDPEMLAEKPFRGINLWPEIVGFRNTLLDYYAAVWRLGCDLHRAIAVDLGLAPEYFADKLDRPLATLRLLHYPPAPPDRPGNIGAGEHTDYGNVTLLATDGVGGLEVRARDGRWLAAPAIPDTFVCNIGDCLMRWTNDTYVSTPHRVVNPAGRERYSVAFFLDANPDAVVECLPTCVGPDRPPRYPPITSSDYLRGRLDATYKAPSDG